MNIYSRRNKTFVTLSDCLKNQFDRFVNFIPTRDTLVSKIKYLKVKLNSEY
jgi:hypothetical protein